MPLLPTTNVFVALITAPTPVIVARPLPMVFEPMSIVYADTAAPLCTLISPTPVRPIHSVSFAVSVVPGSVTNIVPYADVEEFASDTSSPVTSAPAPMVIEPEPFSAMMS
jgi:hypothetical protein